jgi:hypothetical protein
MKTLISSRVTKFGIAGLLVAAATLVAPAARAQDQQVDEKTTAAIAAGEVAFEQLLKDLGVLYQKVTPANGGENEFKISIQGDGETSLIVARIRSYGWNFADGSPLVYVSMYTVILPGGEGHVWSPAIHAKVTEENDYQIAGTITVREWGVYALSSFFLHNIDKEVLNFYLFNTHYNRVNVKNALTPILQTEVAEN